MGWPWRDRGAEGGRLAPFRAGSPRGIPEPAGIVVKIHSYITTTTTTTTIDYSMRNKMCEQKQKYAINYSSCRVYITLSSLAM